MNFVPIQNIDWNFCDPENNDNSYFFHFYSEYTKIIHRSHADREKLIILKHNMIEILSSVMDIELLR